jgi:hypothetical protein
LWKSKNFWNKKERDAHMSDVMKSVLEQQESTIVELNDKELEKIHGTFVIPISNSLSVAITNVAFAAPGTALAVSSVAFANNNNGVF